jgi:hypothetical protein
MVADVPSTMKCSLTDFVNLKIKSDQSFGCAHIGRLCVCIHRDECLYMYEYLRLYCVTYLKKGNL